MKNSWYDKEEHYMRRQALEWSPAGRRRRARPRLNLEWGYNKTNEEARPVWGRRRESRKMETWRHKPLNEGGKLGEGALGTVKNIPPANKVRASRM
jgi:hypothetical protein